MTTAFLIVETNFNEAQRIATGLDKLGYVNYRISTSVIAAMVEIERQRPDIVITGIDLGSVMEGKDLGLLLSEKYKLPYMYIVKNLTLQLIENIKHTAPNAWLMSSFRKNDLRTAIELVKFNSNMSKVDITNNAFCLKAGKAICYIPFKDIYWLQSQENYTLLYSHNNKRCCTRATLTGLYKQFADKNFVRIHKCFVINSAYVTAWKLNHVIIDDTKLPVGRMYKKVLQYSIITILAFCTNI